MSFTSSFKEKPIIMYFYVLAEDIIERAMSFKTATNLEAQEKICIWAGKWSKG